MSDKRRPDFSKFEIASIAARQRWSKGFFYICMTTSMFSIIILVVLISSIIASALPVFGPHEDRIVGSFGRTVMTQADSGDQEVMDVGDRVQGLFWASDFIGGGLGKDNDEKWIEKETGEINRLAIGIYSMQIAEVMEENVCSLEPATGDQSIVGLIEKLGLADSVVGLSAQSNANMVLLTSPTTDSDFDIEKLKIDGPLIGDALIKELKKVDDWQVRLVTGQSADQNEDFTEIKFLDSNQRSIEKLGKTRQRKSAAKMKMLTTVIYDSEASEGFNNVKIRPLSDIRGMNYGQLKLDDMSLAGLNRSDKRRGFGFGSKFRLEWCPAGKDKPGEHLSHFLTGIPSNSDASVAGIGPALWGSIWICSFCALFALPLGIATAVFLEEFRPANRVLRFLQDIVQLNITNLAGVPSIVYGILGLTAFVMMFGLFKVDKGSGIPEFQFGAQYYYQYLSEGFYPILIAVDDPKQPPELTPDTAATDGDYNPISLNVIGVDADLPEDEETLKWTLRTDAVGGLVSEKPWYYFQLPFGRGVLAAALTLMLVILPVIIIASQEAIRAVPSSLREAAMGLGATRWQVVRNVTLPAAIPGIMTGAILAISRAIGEAAPLVVLSGLVFVATSPQHLMDFYSALPIQIFYLTGQPKSEETLINFQNVAAACSLVLLIVLLTFNTFAIVLRQLTQKPLS